MRHDLGNSGISALQLADPAVYRICVHGDVGEDWRDYFGAATVTRSSEAGCITTIVTSQVVDQAELMGMLQVLFNWGSVLAWLECLAVPRTNDVRNRSAKP